MSQLSEEQQERLKQIRERQVLRGNANDRWYVDDCDFLLALLDSDSQVAMTLSPCNTPAQGFNAEREKKVATVMRDKCVEKVRESARSHRRMATEINYGSSVDVPISPEQHIKLADECDLAADELESLTLDQVKPGEM